MLEVVPKFKVSANNSRNLMETLFAYYNFILHKLTYDRYHNQSRY